MIKRYTVYFLLFSAILFTNFTNSAHEFYVSTTMIDYNSKNQSLEMTFKIFTDNLETALEDARKEKIRLGTEREAQHTNQYIEEYLEENIQVLVGDKLVNFEYLGKEDEMELTWCFAEIENIEPIKSITIKNTLLIETFEEQKNIVQVKVDRKKKSLLLSKFKTKGTIVF